jgi:hypothetical protein
LHPQVRRIGGIRRSQRGQTSGKQNQRDDQTGKAHDVWNQTPVPLTQFTE